MNSEDLKAWLERWGLTPAAGARVLKIQKSKMSEYLNGVRSIPAYVAAHAETFDSLTPKVGKELIEKRLA